MLRGFSTTSYREGVASALQETMRHSGASSAQCGMSRLSGCATLRRKGGAPPTTPREDNVNDRAGFFRFAWGQRKGVGSVRNDWLARWQKPRTVVVVGSVSTFFSLDPVPQGTKGLRARWVPFPGCRGFGSLGAAKPRPAPSLASLAHCLRHGQKVSSDLPEPGRVA